MRAQWDGLSEDGGTAEDYGRDRPASLSEGVWGQYKMCAAVAFGDTWCSNPYIETDPGLVQTNCIGCHQLAGSGTAQGFMVWNCNKPTDAEDPSDDGFD